MVDGVRTLDDEYENKPDKLQPGVDPKRIEKKHFRNIIVLGNAVPDEISNDRKAVCAVAYSEEFGLIRLYPVPPRGSISRWEIISVPLERNPQDSRIESWKIQGSKSEWLKLHEKIETVGKLPDKDRIPFLKKLTEKFGYGCIADMNEKKVSLGIIVPDILGTYFEDKENDPTIQSTLTNDTLFMTYQNYKKRPKIRYRCPKCKSKKYHDHGIYEWGAYEFMRKYPGKEEQVFDALKLKDSAFKKTFLVGNMNLHRNNFLVVSVFRYKT